MKAIPPATARFVKIARHPWKFRLFLMKYLPAALIAGVRVRSVSTEGSEVTIPYKWMTRNPFRSTYFASLSMAAEMSTGLLAMAQVFERKPAISMLVISIEGKFHRKATGVTVFSCGEGNFIRETIDRADATGEPQSARVLSSGYNKIGELVAEFWITWSFKQKSGAVRE